MTRPSWETPPPEETLPLFAAAAAQLHSTTSREAAAEIVPVAGGLRRRVLDFIQARGAAGATDEEIANGLGLNPSTARPRRVELVRAGLVAKAGTRKTASGRNADVWKSTKWESNGTQGH